MPNKLLLPLTMVVFWFGLIELQAQNEQHSGVTDIEGNTYNTVIIGNHVWMKENLKTTKYNDGTAIPIVTDNDEWAGLSTGAYSWYKNDSSNGDIYGALYNWFAVKTERLCPAGWRVPSQEEFDQLTEFLGGRSATGGKLKATGTIEEGDGLWFSPNSGATNEAGLTAIPAGYRSFNGYFFDLGYTAYWWTSTGVYPNYAMGMYLRHGWDFNSISYYDRWAGFSVRCIKDLGAH